MITSWGCNPNKAGKIKVFSPVEYLNLVSPVYVCKPFPCWVPFTKDRHTWALGNPASSIRLQYPLLSCFVPRPKVDRERKINTQW